MSWRDTANPEGGGAERYLEKMAEGLVELLLALVQPVVHGIDRAQELRTREPAMPVTPRECLDEHVFFIGRLDRVPQDGFVVDADEPVVPFMDGDHGTPEITAGVEVLG